MNYITTPIYYVNAQPHIGHAYTTVAADAVARYYRLRGDDVRFLTGTDEHGDKVAAAAEAAGQQPEEFVANISKQFQDAFDALNVSYTPGLFWRTDTKRHITSAQDFFQRLYDAGALYEGEYEGLYCVGCESFKTEKDLTSDGLCPDHNKKPELLKETNWFFKFSDYKDRVYAALESGELVVEPESTKKEMLSLFEHDVLEDFSVSRERVEWGIDMPDFAKGQKMYVWVEAVHNYYAATTSWNTDMKQEMRPTWPADLHMIGKDIAKFHVIWWPAMLMALNEDLPRSVVTNGYFTIDGVKMSKSIGNVIDPNDLVEKYGSDAARWLLLSQFPYGQDGDIKADKFDEQYTADLVNGIGNVVSRVLGMIEKYNGSVVPDGSYVFSDSANKSPNTVELSELLLGDGLHSPLSLLHSVTTISKTIQIIDQHISETEPWVLMKDPEKHQQQLDDLFITWLTDIHVLSWAIASFLPETANRIRQQLGLSLLFEQGSPILSNEVTDSLDSVWLVSGSTLGERTPLFPRLS